MRPLLVADLLPLAEYAGRRREYFEAHQRYLDRHRRVRVGPSLTLLFENRQTLWFRVQEIVRIARLTTVPMIRRELDLCNRLLPGPNQLQAALLVDMDEKTLSEDLQRWQTLHGDELRLRIGGTATPADLLTCRPEDRCTCTAYWVQFSLSPAQSRPLAGPPPPAFFEVTAPHYQHTSKPLSHDVRTSLAEDLAMSARDAA